MSFTNQILAHIRGYTKSLYGLRSTTTKAVLGPTAISGAQTACSNYLSSLSCRLPPRSDDACLDNSRQWWPSHSTGDAEDTQSSRLHRSQERRSKIAQLTDRSFKSHSELALPVTNAGSVTYRKSIIQPFSFVRLCTNVLLWSTRSGDDGIYSKLLLLLSYP